MQNFGKGPTLLVLAAGMGSRYGGLKQIDRFGPNGETILDYSIYDAIRAGFSKVVFIIRESFKKDIQEFFAGKFDHLIEIEYVCQELNKIPQGVSTHAERVKPWGTGHAVLVGVEAINEPFAVINADDYYGPDSYHILYKFLTGNTQSAGKYALIAYQLSKTMSEHGTVNRGVCATNKDKTLANIKECLKIGYDDQHTIFYTNDNGQKVVLAPETPVSMNMWGFYPDYFEYSQELFFDFLLSHGNELTSEFLIPTVIDTLIQTNQKKVVTLECKEEWFGVTYQEDKPFVIERLRKLIDTGVYPENLWNSN